MPSNRRDRDELDDDRPRRRQRDSFDDDPGYARPPAKGPKGVNVCGIIALVLGLVGLVTSLVPCIGVIGLPLAAIGLVLGIIGLMTSGQNTGRGLPIAGTCVSLAGLLIGGGWLLFFVYLGKRGQEKAAAIQQQMQADMKAVQEQARLAEEKRQMDEKEFREGKAVAVTAATLFTDFDTNPLSADTKYKGKLLEVTGTLRRVDRDRIGRLAVELEAGDDTNGVVRCEFPREAQSQLSSLKPRQKMVVRGKCAGMGKQDQVKLDNCLIVSK